MKGTQPNLLDINILPSRYRRRRLTWRAILLGLTPLLFALLLSASGYLWLDTSARLQQQQEALRRAQAALDEYQPLLDQQEDMAAQLEGIRTQSDQIHEAVANASLRDLHWSEALELIVRTIPEGVEITNIDLSESEVSISGNASDHMLPLSLADLLFQSPLIADITINSIEEFLPQRSDDGAEQGDEAPWYRFEILVEIRP
jgi:Tfp pilus assembly protein PilN